MGAVDEPVAAPKRRKRAKGLFANSPLTVLDSGDPTQIIDLIRKGLPAQAVDFVASLLSLSRAAFLQSDQDSAKHRGTAAAEQAEALTLEESDRVSRVAKVLRRAVEVFGDDAQAKAWMIDSVSSLGGRTPLSLLDTMEGYELVTNTLARIEYGVYGCSAVLWRIAQETRDYRAEDLSGGGAPRSADAGTVQARLWCTPPDPLRWPILNHSPTSVARSREIAFSSGSQYPTGSGTGRCGRK